jgi:acetylornithine deacetylase/succinyl-diaminopimelate desuccinylase-like protein
MTPSEYARAHQADAMSRLKEFLAIPSVSTVAEHAADVLEAAGWVADRARKSGFQDVRVDRTEGHPVVYARWQVDSSGPTVLVYGHYDVQPPDPLEQWQSPPFQPTERGGAVYARGASDDKGQVLVHLEAVAAYQATLGAPPVNVTLVVEGEEEVGSPSLTGWLRAHRQELGADAAVISDTAMAGPGQPSLVVALRGLAYLELTVSGPHHDLHSGQYGGAVRNPASVLAAIVAALHSPDGRVAVPGFYDRVRTLSPEERLEMARLPFDEAAFLAAAGPAGDWGEPGFSRIERLGARPTLDVNGLVSGWTGQGAKTVLPAFATAKVSMRLVPDQEPGEIGALFEAYVRRLAPSDVSVDVVALHGARPGTVDRNTPAMRAAARALETAFGRPVVYTREGGSIPVVAMLQEELGLESVLMGFGLPDDNLHAPNEKLDLANFHAGTQAVIAFLHHLAAEAGRP